MAKDVSQESAKQIALDFMKKQKNTEKIDVAAIDRSRSSWVVRGTCPIDMEGHPWAEKFEVVVDAKGNVTKSRSSLL